jgi:ribonucleoside-diphosphate reductase alpha chain
MPADGDLVAYREQINALLGKRDWVRRAHKFAANYFQGDVRRMTYCLKQVHNCKSWEDISRDYQPVDFTLMAESEDNTKLADTVACAGGKCDLV